MLLASTISGAAGGPPANSLRELYVELQKCLAAPGGVAGSELTIVFSLRRDGSLLGRPRISYSKLLGGAAEQLQFGEGVAAAFNQCLPLPITDALGGAIAGRPISIRFTVGRRQTNT
jgi:hypothetical protein